MTNFIQVTQHLLRLLWTGMGADGRHRVTKRWTTVSVNTKPDNIGNAPEPNLTVLVQVNCLTLFRHYCMSMEPQAFFSLI